MSCCCCRRAGASMCFSPGACKLTRGATRTCSDAAGCAGPGAAGGPLAAAVRRTILYTMNHDTRTFVPRVAHVRVPGWGAGIRRARPRWWSRRWPCWTSCDGQMRLVSTHGGADAAAVQAATGFPLLLPPAARALPRRPRRSPAPAARHRRRRAALDGGALTASDRRTRGKEIKRICGFCLTKRCNQFGDHPLDRTEAAEPTLSASKGVRTSQPFPVMSCECCVLST